MKITKEVSDSGIVRYTNENGECHNKNGEPAIIYTDGAKCWYKNGKLHNEDGPAYIAPNGLKSWYLDNIFYPEQQWKDEMFKRCFKP